VIGHGIGMADRLRALRKRQRIPSGISENNSENADMIEVTVFSVVSGRARSLDFMLKKAV